MGREAHWGNVQGSGGATIPRLEMTAWMAREGFAERLTRNHPEIPRTGNLLDGVNNACGDKAAGAVPEGITGFSGAFHSFVQIQTSIQHLSPFRSA